MFKLTAHSTTIKIESQIVKDLDYHLYQASSLLRSVTLETKSHQKYLRLKKDLTNKIFFHLQEANKLHRKIQQSAIKNNSNQSLKEIGDALSVTAQALNYHQNQVKKLQERLDIEERRQVLNNE